MPGTGQWWCLVPVEWHQSASTRGTIRGIRAMEKIEIIVLLFTIILIIGQVFRKSPIPTSLLLVLVGMILSYIPEFPRVTLNPEIILDIFLPLLVYQISTMSSWYDFRKNLRPIALLSVGHVIFITVAVAVVIHALIPELGWPLSFVLGAVISPPDDVAIVSVAEKIRLPNRVISILQGEGLLNDAAALILFRLALAAVFASQISITQGILSFFVLILGEAAYGFILGNLLGTLRLRIASTQLHMIASFLTPFFAYIPCVLLGGSGVLATVVTGFVIGHRFAVRFTPEFRLVARAIWPMLAFALECVLFLLVGLDMRLIIENIAPLPAKMLIYYSIVVILTVIIGRFIWVYLGNIFLPRFLFPPIRKKDPFPPWQYPFIISWAGMRGGISLAAALAVPYLPDMGNGTSPRALLIFLVFAVILATFVLQGLTLPWLIKVTGIREDGTREAYDEHMAELNARLEMCKAALQWLKRYREDFNDDKSLCVQLNLYIKEYQNLRADLKKRIAHHHGILDHEEEAEEVRRETFLLSQIIEVERAVLLDLWRTQKISFELQTKLLDKLDHRASHAKA